MMSTITLLRVYPTGIFGFSDIIVFYLETMCQRTDVHINNGICMCMVQMQRVKMCISSDFIISIFVS